MIPTIARNQMEFQCISRGASRAFDTKKPPQLLADCGGLDRAFGFSNRFFHGSAISVSGIYDIGEFSYWNTTGINTLNDIISKVTFRGGKNISRNRNNKCLSATVRLTLENIPCRWIWAVILPQKNSRTFIITADWRARHLSDGDETFQRSSGHPILIYRREAVKHALPGCQRTELGSVCSREDLSRGEISQEQVPIWEKLFVKVTPPD